MPGRSTLISKRSADASAEATNLSRKETELRTRPWVGSKDIEFVPASGTGIFLDDTLIFDYRNVGVLPADNLALDLDIATRSARRKSILASKFVRYLSSP